MEEEEAAREGIEIEMAGTSEAGSPATPITPCVRALRPGGLSKVLSSVFALDGIDSPVVASFVADKDEAAAGMTPAPVDFELLRVVGQGAFGKVRLLLRRRLRPLQVARTRQSYTNPSNLWNGCGGVGRGGRA